MAGYDEEMDLERALFPWLDMEVEPEPDQGEYWPDDLADGLEEDDDEGD